MKLFRIFLIIFISFFIYAQTDANYNDYESNIFEESNTLKITKLQNLFKELGLYNWNIDGKYLSIKPSLLAYQKKSNIIKYDNDYWAWYFWKRTLIALEKEYWSNFTDLADIHILKEKPKTWERYFYVTAYYSPLKWQNRYTTGSYWWDIRLNGNWKHTASWKAVYTGILAAPRNYDYGTKIELKWIWIWAVEDRWWAIVNSWERWFEHDRIDIWMWYWDEWLLRALKWWKRKVLWRIVEKSNKVNITFDESIVAKYLPLKVNPYSDKESVEKLQKLFAEINLYTWSIDWKYDSIKDQIIKYQIQNGIIRDKYADAAWYFWPKTLNTIKSKYRWWIFIANTYHSNEYETSLTRREIIEVKKIKTLLNEYISKKTWNDIKKSNKYKTKLKSNLDKIIKKTFSKTKKQKLKFLKSII